LEVGVRAVLLRSVVARLVVGLMVVSGAAAAARAENNNCGEPPEKSHYVAVEADSEDAQHLVAERPFSGEGQFELNVCAGEVRVQRGHGDKLRVLIATDKPAPGKMSDYVHTLDVSANHATISLQYPRRLHALVVVELPSSKELKSKINLGAGKLVFHGEQVKGDRELNLGAGQTVVMLVGDRDYAHFAANVGLGSLHDNRQGGSSAHFVVSREFSGKGTGGLEANVGAGSIDIEPAKEDAL
jgi:hypothetical protein